MSSKAITIGYLRTVTWFSTTFRED